MKTTFRCIKTGELKIVYTHLYTSETYTYVVSDVPDGDCYLMDTWTWIVVADQEVSE